MTHTKEDNDLLLKCVEGVGRMTRDLYELSEEEVGDDDLNRIAIGFLFGASCGLWVSGNKTASKWLQAEIGPILKAEHVATGIKELLLKLRAAA